MIDKKVLDEVAPQHDRESCDDNNLDNAGVDWVHGHLYCRRCHGLSLLEREGLVDQLRGVVTMAHFVSQDNNADYGGYKTKYTGDKTSSIPRRYACATKQH